MYERTEPLPILVVEDNEDNLDVIERNLQRRGYCTAKARNGREGCDRASELRPALILMDLEMPIMSGFEALKEIRGIPAISATTIFALTAHATKEIQQECKAAGFDNFVTKPIDFRYLLFLIDKSGVTLGAPNLLSSPYKGG